MLRHCGALRGSRGRALGTVPKRSIAGISIFKKPGIFVSQKRTAAPLEPAARTRGRRYQLMHSLLHKRDFYAGGLMVLFGLVAALKGPDYRMGTLMHMGPG